MPFPVAHRFCPSRLREGALLVTSSLSREAERMETKGGGGEREKNSLLRERLSEKKVLFFKSKLTPVLSPLPLPSPKPNFFLVGNGNQKCINPDN